MNTITAGATGNPVDLNQVIDWLKGALSDATATAFPVGMVIPWAGPSGSAPAGWLECNGASVSTTTYAHLFAVTGYSFGGSGGSFNLPDMRGRTPLGVGQSSTTSSTNHFLANAAGEERHTLVVAEMPTHTHTQDNIIGARGGGNMNAFGTNGIVDQFDGAGVQTGSAGSSNPHENRQPWIALTYLVKT